MYICIYVYMYMCVCKGTFNFDIFLLKLVFFYTFLHQIYSEIRDGIHGCYLQIHRVMN